MRQQQFEQRHAALWQQLEATVTHLEQGGPAPAPMPIAAFPEAYRRLCHHLALARQRGYSLALVAQLNSLVLRGHRQLYQHRPALLPRLRRLLTADFPRAVRAQWRWHLASTAAFGLAMLFTWVLVAMQPDMAYSVLGESMTLSLESMYGDASFRSGRDSQDDVMMFGYYIYNNISIAFRSFAGGLAFGIGALVVMIFNGGFFGAAAAHINNVGATEPFFTFVVAHGAPELTAIVLAGGAGLQLGMAVLAPGPYRRLDALRHAAVRALPVVYGVFLMLLLAAFIEAFWSPRDLPAAVKYSVGAACWALLAAYLLLTGRDGARR